MHGSGCRALQLAGEHGALQPALQTCEGAGRSRRVAGARACQILALSAAGSPPGAAATTPTIAPPTEVRYLRVFSTRRSRAIVPPCPQTRIVLLLEDGGAARTGVLGERQRAAVHRVRPRASESARCEAKTVLQVTCISQTL